MAWALAALGCVDSPLLAAISSESRAKLSDIEPQSLANLAWAFATLGFLDSPLLDAISAEAIPKIRHFA